jgi:asparagine synthetase B (glutamine-hydrolysing)
MASLKEVGASFFAFGWIQNPTNPILKDRMQCLGNNLIKFPVMDIGYFFCNRPFYVDIAESDDFVIIKLGHVHDGEKLLTTQELLDRELICPEGVKANHIRGSSTLICFMKDEPRSYIYRNMLSTFAINYWSDNGNFIATDNLRLMVDLVYNPQINEDAIYQHYIYRTVYGRQTYIRNVKRQLPGEILTWVDGKLDVVLERDLRDYSNPADQKSVSQETVDWFNGKMNQIISIYLDGRLQNAATMLSGGVDSSLIQASINSYLGHDGPFPTYSFSVDTPTFEFEVEYAKKSSTELKTHHTFLKVTAEKYRDMLIKGIEVLGQPLPDDVRPCFMALIEAINSHNDEHKILFHGQIADGLHGVSSSLEVVQGDKYRRWSPGVLELIGRVLRPISQSKSYGATKAAQILRREKDLNSPGHFLNSLGSYTDWEMVRRCFSTTDISKALAMKRDMGSRYLDSEYFVEQLNVEDLMTDGIDPACVVNEFGLYHGIEFVFPFSDETIIEATFSFSPIERYTYGNRVKPILKAALETMHPRLLTDQPKGWSGLGEQALFDWMREGALSEIVRDIERPGFMEQSDFDRKLEHPDWFTWSMLTLNLFNKLVLKSD